MYTATTDIAAEMLLRAQTTAKYGIDSCVMCKLKPLFACADSVETARAHVNNATRGADLTNLNTQSSRHLPGHAVQLYKHAMLSSHASVQQG